MSDTAVSRGLLKNEDRIALYESSEYEVHRCGRVKEAIRGNFASQRTVLEIGPGPGVFTEELLTMGCRVLAAEPAKDRVQALQARFSGSPLSQSLEIIEEFFPFAPAKSPAARSLDGVIALEVIEHVSDPERFLEECARVLRPGGKLLLSTPNRFSMEAAIHLLKYVFKGQVWYAGDPTHLWIFTPGQIARMIRKAGFKITFREAIHFGCGDKAGGKIPSLPITFRRFQSSSRWPFNRLGFNLVFVAEKIQT